VGYLEQYCLYLVLKDLINNIGFNYKISFNDYDINSDNIIGILFKSGNNPKYRELSTGKYYSYTNRVQLIIQSSYSKDSLIELLNLIYKIREVLTSDINNKKYKVSSVKYIAGKFSLINNNTNIDGEDVYVTISKTHLIGDVDFKSKTSQTRSIYSLNLMFDYFINIGGN
jgi:hypothetical protein